jgi:hypothetical protein
MEGNSSTKACIMLNSRHSGLEFYAAAELQRCLMRLFRISAAISSVNGFIADSYFVIKRNDSDTADPHDDQTFVLKKIIYEGVPAVIISGSTSRSLLWGVYKLLEIYGMRFLTTEDIYPLRHIEFYLPDVDMICRPVFAERAWRGINVFAMGPESWGLREYRLHIDQLAKMRFNTYILNMFTHQPFVDIKLGPNERRYGDMLHAWKMTAEDPFVGKELFSGKNEFINDDFVSSSIYHDRVSCGQKLAHGIMEYAKLRGFETAITISLMEVPREYRTEENGYESWQWGTSPDITHPDFIKNVCRILKTYTDSYPEADRIHLGISEFRNPLLDTHGCWEALNKKYDLDADITYAEVMEKASNRKAYPGGTERAAAEVRGDIEALFLIDRIFNEAKPFEDTARPDMKIAFTDFAEELNPILYRVLPSGSRLYMAYHYTATGVAQRLEVFGDMPSTIDACHTVTLQDDNIGIVSQLTTKTTASAIDAMKKNSSWNGYMVRLWTARDLEPSIAYLAGASWDPDMTAEKAYEDHLTAVCGKENAKKAAAAFEELESITGILDERYIGIGFPAPVNAISHCFTGEMAYDEMLPVIADMYDNCLVILEDCLKSIETDQGRNYICYFIARFFFSRNYFYSLYSLQKAGIASRNADKAVSAPSIINARIISGKDKVSCGNDDWRERAVFRREAYGYICEAVRLLKEGIEKLVPVTLRDARGLGLIATLNEFFYKTAVMYKQQVKIKMDDEQGNAAT